jgi:hypothetical protein
VDVVTSLREKLTAIFNEEKGPRTYQIKGEKENPDKWKNSILPSRAQGNASEEAITLLINKFQNIKSRLARPN